MKADSEKSFVLCPFSGFSVSIFSGKWFVGLESDDFFIG
jgi:hypothetical protein